METVHERMIRRLKKKQHFFAYQTRSVPIYCCANIKYEMNELETGFARDSLADGLMIEGGSRNRGNLAREKIRDERTRERRTIEKNKM